MACRFCSKRSAFAVEKGPKYSSWHGPSEHVLRGLDDETFDAVVSDPPFAAGATSLLGRLQSSATKYQNTGIKRQQHPIDGDSMLPDAWEFMISSVLRQCYRVMKPGADLLFFCDWRSLPGFLKCVGGTGFQLRAVPIWNKGRGCRPQRNGFRNQSEMILWAKRPGKLERSDPDRYLDGVFTHATMTDKCHLTQKPVALMRELLAIVPTGGHVLDPFQGSGSTGVAALQLGLRYVGIESTEHYHAVAVERLKAKA